MRVFYILQVIMVNSCNPRVSIPTDSKEALKFFQELQDVSYEVARNIIISWNNFQKVFAVLSP